MPREEKRRLIVDYIKSHPNATHRELRLKLRLHPERIFNSLKEAFLEAGLKPPRTFEKKTLEEKKKIIIDYIRKSPAAGGQTIVKDTKINLCNVFKDTKSAFEAAGIPYPRINRKTKQERRKEIIDLIRKNPYITLEEIMKKTSKSFYKTFDSLKKAYREAGVEILKGGDKIANRKRNWVIEFIKKNTLATQREINNACKTHVQLLFNRGIYEAYEQAGVTYPYERLKVHGVVLKDIKNRSKNFEDKIASKLIGYGNVSRLVKSKRGFADIVLERKGKKIIVEVKDYKVHEISMSDIKQLNRYLEDFECNLGILICNKKPKKDRFLIGKNKIYVLEEDQLDQIPLIVED